MANPLIQQIRKAREASVKVGEFEFTYRRPTDVEAVELYRGNAEKAAIAARFVVGWAGVKETDLISSGSTDAAVFDPVLWAEWCADSPDFWAPISDAVMAAYLAHSQAVEDAAKN